jgi:hypothetical protein
MPDQQAETIAASEGGKSTIVSCSQDYLLIQDIGPRKDRSSASREGDAGDGKMENDLEMRKANKVTTRDASDVAGRKGKGTGTGLLEKLVAGK